MYVRCVAYYVNSLMDNEVYWFVCVVILLCLVSNMQIGSKPTSVSHCAHVDDVPSVVVGRSL